MKKILAVGALVLAIGAGSLVVNADAPKTQNLTSGERNSSITIEERDAWRAERHSYRQDELKKALENGEITEAEFKEWEDHFSYMEEFHNKNRDKNSGFMMGGRHGGCGGNGMGGGRMRSNR